MSRPHALSLPRHHGLVYVAMAIAVTFPMILSLTMINVALPDIMLALGMDLEQAQLLSSTSLLAATSATLLAPYLWQRLGARNTVRVALGLFAVASILAASAATPEMMIVGRIGQGAAAGIIQPLSFLIVAPAFPLRQRGLAMGLVGIGILLAPALGPIYAGWVTDHLGWRSLFLILVPWCLGCMAAAESLPSQPESAAEPFDFVGFACLTGALAFLLWGLSGSLERRQPPREVLLVTAFMLVAAFAWLQYSRRSGLLDVTLFARVDFLFCTIVLFVLGFGIFGSILLVPLFLQTIAGFTPLAAGQFLLPAGLVMALASPVCGHLCDRINPPFMLATGLALFALSCFLLAGIDVQSDAALLSMQVILGRIGLAILFPAIYALSLNCLPVHKMPQGSGIVNFVRQLGGALGTAVLVVALSHREATWQAAWMQTDVAAFQIAEAQARLAPVLGTTGVDNADLLAQSWILDTVGKAAGAQAYRDLFEFMGFAFTLCLVPTVALAIRFGSRSRSTQD